MGKAAPEAGDELGQQVRELVQEIARLEREKADREKLEAGIRQASSYARSLIEASPDPLVTISAEGKIMDVNQGTERATGVPRERLIGSDFCDYFTEPERARQGYRTALLEGFVKDYPLAIRHVSGAVTDVLYNAAVFRNDDGETQGIFAAARDITERKRAEHQVNERVKELQAFYHLSAMAGRRDYPLERLYREMANVLPQSWQYPEITCARIVMGEREFRSDDFEPSRWMLVAPIRVAGDIGGRIEIAYRVAKPVQDEGPFLKEERQLIDAVAERLGQITELKQAEEALRQGSAYTRSLIEASLDPLVTISAEGTITDVNEATVRATGVIRDVLLGSDFSNYFTDPEKARAGYRQAFARGFVTDYPLALRHASGTVMEVLYNASVYRNERGEVAGVFAAARDITERKRAEEMMARFNAELEQRVALRTAELEAANRELEEFSYSISHDMRAPLRAIDGFSQILLEEHGEQLDDEGRRLQTEVHRNAQRMGQLIDDLLEFLHIRKRRLTMDFVDVAALAKEAFAEIQSVVPAAGQAMLRVGIPAPAWGDRELISQALRNLLSNAVKFSSPGHAPLIEVGGTAGTRENIYYIRDNGVGFDMRFAGKLFKVFERVHPTGQYEGTAIGLAIVKRIIERHGGRVWAEGEVGNGATFYFSLPNRAGPDGQPGDPGGGGVPGPFAA